jgi:hypothetical protein
MNTSATDRRDKLDRQTFILNYDKFFKEALKNLLERNDYHTARPIERHKMLMNELETLYEKKSE